MNSYNENLHSEIVTSLNNQEIELKKLKAITASVAQQIDGNQLEKIL